MVWDPSTYICNKHQIQAHIVRVGLHSVFDIHKGLSRLQDVADHWIDIRHRLGLEKNSTLQQKKRHSFYFPRSRPLRIVSGTVLEPS